MTDQAAPAKRKPGEGNTPFVDYEPCVAHRTSYSRSTGEEAGARCKRRPAPGTVVCHKHGGGIPAVREKGRERLRVQQIEKDATAQLAAEGITTIADPLEELGKLASSAQHLTYALGARVNALTELEHFDAKQSPAIKAEVQMYEKAMDRSARLLDQLVKHGYTERQVQLAEREANMVAGVIRRVIHGLGLTPEQTAKAQQLMADEFRQLEEGTQLI